MGGDCLETIEAAHNKQFLNTIKHQRLIKSPKIMPWWWQAADDVLYRQITAYLKARDGENTPLVGRELSLPSLEAIQKIDDDPIVQLLSARTILNSSIRKVVDQLENGIIKGDVGAFKRIPGRPTVPLEWLGLCERDHGDQENMWITRLTCIYYGVYPSYFILRQKITEFKDRLRRFSPIRDYVDLLQEENLELIR